jgi:hypothetical protein
MILRKTGIHFFRIMLEALSRRLLDGLDQGHAFALPVTGTHHHNLVRATCLFNLEPA